LFYSNVLGIGFSTAITPLAAEADGKKVLRGRSVFHHGLYLCTILGIPFGLIFFKAADCLMQPDNGGASLPYLDIVAFP
jgi:MATE family multidrug resistance protein